MSFSVWSAFYENYKGVIWMIALAFALHAIPDYLADNVIGRFQRVPMPVYIALFFVFVLIYGYFKSSEPVMPIYLQF
jgi:alginate O-acetyltransferase complex protein AlgI